MPDAENRAQQSAVESDVPVAMRKVYRRLQSWRQRRRGRERIPEALWAAAGELAREHGVNPVSRALHLEFKQLKHRVEADGPKDRKRAAPAFVELIAPHASASRECVLELEGPGGKLRMELKEMAAAELADISRALWEMLA